MPLYRFEQNDIFHNRIETHPQCNFILHNGNVYFNNRPQISGSFTSSVPNVPSGYINLYELNADRSTTHHTFDSSVDDIDKRSNPPKKSLIFPYLVKDGTFTDFKTISLTTVDGVNVDAHTAAEYGAILTGSYPLSATIVKEYFAADHVVSSRTTLSHSIAEENLRPVSDDHGIQIKSKLYNKIKALENVLDYYLYLSPHYAYSTASSPFVGWNKGVQELGLVSVPSIFYGSSIEKGTVNLKFYTTGTLLAELKDSRKNGELVQVGPTGSNESGSVAGVVLYNEGFLILTGSWDLSEGLHTENYTGSIDKPKWICFGQSISGTITAPSSSFELNFSGTNHVPVMTMLAHARKGQLNHSNNPSYIEYKQTMTPISSSIKYLEQPELKLANLVSSSYSDPTASFRKHTFISEIGVYDRDRNLIAIAKPATPVKKTEERDFTFKLKLDF